MKLNLESSLSLLVSILQIVYVVSKLNLVFQNFRYRSKRHNPITLFPGTIRILTLNPCPVLKLGDSGNQNVSRQREIVYFEPEPTAPVLGYRQTP